jgi:hypothetical protein
MHRSTCSRLGAGQHIDTASTSTKVTVRACMATAVNTITKDEGTIQPAFFRLIDDNRRTRVTGKTLKRGAGLRSLRPARGDGPLAAEIRKTLWRWRGQDKHHHRSRAKCLGRADASSSTLHTARGAPAISGTSPRRSQYCRPVSRCCRSPPSSRSRSDRVWSLSWSQRSGVFRSDLENRGPW